MVDALVSELMNRHYPLWVLLLIVLVMSVLALLLAVSQRRKLRMLKASAATEIQLKTLALQAERDHIDSDLGKLEGEFESLQFRFDALQRQKNDVDLLLAQNQARWQEKERAHEASLALLQSAQGTLAKEFENIANRLFDDKQKQFSRLSTAQIESVIGPFNRQLRDFHQRVDDFHRQDIAQRHQLMGQISELQKQSQQIGKDAVDLASALKGNNKAQGSWGELILDRVLEQAGLVNGREFETQVSYVDEHGKRFQPDAVVHLPGKKQVIIDAKVSLVAYERYSNAEHKGLQAQALKEHVESVRAHIKGLASKQYAQLSNINTLDFVCLFIPIEAAFVAVAQNAPAVLQEAYEQKIVLVSPSSLLLVLKTVDSLWQRERQDHNVELIVATAGKLYDQFVRFVESMDEIGVGLDKAKDAHRRAFTRLAEGRGNLVKRAESLKQLGAKAVRKLPPDLVLAAQVNDTN